jgi:oligoendopeptidase F
MTLADTNLTAADVAWDLEPLVDGAGAAGAERLFDDAEVRAQGIAERYRGRLAELDAGGLAELMHELAEIGERAGRAGNYAHLRFAVDTADPEAGALLARSEERGTAINNEILFVELEWAALDDEQADAACQ